jgi:anti-sigma factor RsiW
MNGRWAKRPLMCPEVRRLLQRYLDGEVDDLKAKRIARHLEDCRRCGLRAETYSAIKRSLHEHRPEVPAETIERLRAFAAGLETRHEAPGESAGA